MIHNYENVICVYKEIYLTCYLDDIQHMSQQTYQFLLKLAKPIQYFKACCTTHIRL